MQIAVPLAVIGFVTAFWFFTVQDQSVSVPGLAMKACENCGVEATHVPPAIFVPPGQEAVHCELAPPPEFVGPVQVT